MENNQETKKNNKALYLIIIAGVCIVLLIGGWFLADKWINRDTETKPSNSNTNTNTNQSTVNYKDYIGTWYVDGDKCYSASEDEDCDQYERQLYIVSVNDDGTIEFSFEYYRIAGVEWVTATLKGNVAYYDELVYVYDLRLAGTLTFNDNSITMTITDSEFDEVDTETIVFNKRYE